MNPITSQPVDRRRVLALGGLTAAAVPLAGLQDTPAAGDYDRYLRQLAAAGRFSGVVLLSHRGRTVLSRAYGMADEQRRIPNQPGTAFSLSSAGKPFCAVAVLQLAQRGKLQLDDPIGKHLSGFATEVAEQVTIHHLLSGCSGLVSPPEEVRRVFHSRDEVHEFFVRRARQARLVGVPWVPSTEHAEAEAIIPPLVVEAVSGMTYWDYVQKHIFDRCGMTGSGFFTRDQWLRDPHLAHPYMQVADGRVVDALHHLDQGSPFDYVLGKNPGRAFIDAPGDGGFATAPDLVRFVRALGDGTLLDRPWADVLTAARIPHGSGSFAGYGLVADIVGGQWMFQRAGGNPGVGANWSSYPDTGWTGVILANRDGASLIDVLAQETLAVTGVWTGGGAGG
ncbi:serine hydrolase [Actinoplanes ianthinogenes]|uniref:Serine hydrolase n=1 Tax=Actinoplanes ianthinogenes TaxID=122358 RepID=A0ABM7M7U6_9ACTN|nr:serine hydrolase domain-containing protein [Actinoplanes ianthinogenes]BCJ47708.1 serine hydrolase [Actinoplanes ianthinogenes]GGR03623.1 serine hydrolase [Actinoplanes ianthinogenes]